MQVITITLKTAHTPTQMKRLKRLGWHVLKGIDIGSADRNGYTMAAVIKPDNNSKIIRLA